MDDLFLYLEKEYYRSDSDLQFSLAARLAFEHKPDVGGLRLREGYDSNRTATLLKYADDWLVSAGRHGESFEALGGAALIYTAVVDATARSTETWWSVHTTAYSVFTGALEEGFGLKLRLDRDAQRRLYEEAIAAAERPRSRKHPSESDATESLLMLMKEYVELLES